MDADALRATAAVALRAAGASFGFVFEWRSAGGQPRPDSDLDVAAFWPGTAPAPWDVSVPNGVDLLVLSDGPRELANNTALFGELLFESDPADRVHWVAMTRKNWLDERPRFQRAHREFMEALRGG